MQAVSLARFQDAFVAALLDGDAGAGPLAALAGQPGFAVYRNTVLKGSIDALQANFPAVVRLVGEEWFRAAAAVHARAHPPQLPMLAEYGANFPDFLAGFEPAQAFDYLPDVARLDRLWSETHAAPDMPVLASDALQRLAPEQLACTVLVPHVAAHWRWFPDMPVYTIWQRNREGADEVGELDWQGEGALLTRGADGGVRWAALSRGGCAFLDACASGATISEAAATALDADARTDLSALIATLLTNGALSRLDAGGLAHQSGNRS